MIGYVNKLSECPMYHLYAGHDYQKISKKSVKYISANIADN